jgi:UDP-N-acetylglucosamine 2-epimerase (non-hydrolysing)
LGLVNKRAIAYLVGARPNFVKMAPLIAEMRRRAGALEHLVVNAGQHYDPEMSAIFVTELGIGSPDYQLDVGSGSHGAQTGRALERIEEVLDDVRPVALVVPGDVNSTLAGALAASKLGIPTAHLEAGLRSFDRTMPEEINRVLTDQLSRWCFTHSPEAAENLRREGVDSSRIFFVGNTMIDTLVRTKPAIERSTIMEKLGVAPGSYVLVTLHRPALVDGRDFAKVLASLSSLADWATVVFPVHPRTRKRIGPSAVHPELRLVPPVGYIDFLALEQHARAVITDSGGVQEETTYLGVPCFTMRANTERPVTVSHGTNRLIGTDAAALEEIPALLAHPTPAIPPPEGWDGRAAVRAADILVAELDANIDASVATTGAQ